MSTLGHAEQLKALVELQRDLALFDDDGAVVAAEDDGVGFDVQASLADYAARGSLGLLQMRESARLIGAHVQIDFARGQGTRIRLRIPLR